MEMTPLIYFNTLTTAVNTLSFYDLLNLKEGRLCMLEGVFIKLIKWKGG